MRLNALRGARALVVASTGGHLSQAVRWHERLGLSEASTFVTFDNEQSRSLVGRRPHRFVPYVAPRDWTALAGAARAIYRDEALRDVDLVLSTGAAVALAGLPVAYRQRVPYLFVESVSRFDGPSLTGRMLERAPRVHRFTQHVGYAGPRWSYAGSLLDQFGVTEDPCVGRGDRPLRIFVTLGTIRPYRFDRMVDAVAAAVTDADEVVWQLGVTDREGLPGVAHSSMSASDFDAAIQRADVVVTHAGVGTVLRLLELGKRPVVYAREASRREHVDDHQQQALSELGSRGLVIPGEGADARASMLLAASTAVVTTSSDVEAHA